MMCKMCNMLKHDVTWAYSAVIVAKKDVLLPKPECMNVENMLHAILNPAINIVQCTAHIYWEQTKQYNETIAAYMQTTSEMHRLQ